MSSEVVILIASIIAATVSVWNLARSFAEIEQSRVKSAKLQNRSERFGFSGQ